MIILLLVFFLAVIIFRNRENLIGKYLKVGEDGVVEGGRSNTEFDDKYLEKGKEYKDIYADRKVAFSDI